jgi:hypothetical protein
MRKFLFSKGASAASGVMVLERSTLNEWHQVIAPGIRGLLTLLG